MGSRIHFITHLLFTISSFVRSFATSLLRCSGAPLLVVRKVLDCTPSCNSTHRPNRSNNYHLPAIATFKEISSCAAV